MKQIDFIVGLGAFTTTPNIYNGSMALGENDQVKVSFISGSIAVSVKDLLNRSGLVTADPFGEERGRVRFEPLWLHRFLISKHDRRLADGNVKQTPVAVR